MLSNLRHVLGGVVAAALLVPLPALALSFSGWTTSTSTSPFNTFDWSTQGGSNSTLQLGFSTIGPHSITTATSVTADMTISGTNFFGGTSTVSGSWQNANGATLTSLGSIYNVQNGSVTVSIVVTQIAGGTSTNNMFGTAASPISLPSSNATINQATLDDFRRFLFGTTDVYDLQVKFTFTPNAGKTLTFSTLTSNWLVNFTTP
jgi:hypothetical protein